GTAAEWNDDHTIADVDKPKVPATFVIAASNSLDTVRADYVCDGTDDQVTINGALGDLPAQGGKILLLEGTYDISAAITITDDDITIQGCGKNTRLAASADVSMLTANNVSGLIVRDLYFYGFGFGGVANIGVYFTTVTGSKIENCWFENTAGEQALRLHTNSHRCIVSACIFLFNWAASIQVSNSNYCVISGNTFDESTTAIDLVGSDFNTITANTLFDSINNGVFLTSSDDNVISSNTIFTAQGGTVGVRIFSGSERNTVIGNQISAVVDDVLIADAGSDWNHITNNYFLNGGITDGAPNTIQTNNAP
ncbi:unnamed protein product, partial [marine sediment metagenome]